MKNVEYKHFCCVCEKEVCKENIYCEGWNWVCGFSCFQLKKQREEN